MPLAALASTVYAPPTSNEGWKPEDVYAGARLRYFSFGRRALAAGLRALGVGKGDAVLLPAFLCRDVLSSLADVGAEAVYYPVAPDLSPASPPADWPMAKAVLAVDYFGFPQDLAPLRAYCARAGAALIEDAAHALFSRDGEGRLLGTRGDLGILSLRKSLALPNGAALLAPKDSKVVLPEQAPFDAPDEPRYLFRQALRVAARNLGAPNTLRALTLARRARRALRGYSVPPPDPAAERELPEPESPCGQLAVPIRVGDPALEALRRRELYKALTDDLSGVAQPVFPRLPDGCVPYAFAFRAQDEAAAAARLAVHGLAVLPWPDLPDALAAAAPAHHKDVRLAHFLW